ncbi:MAG TPA: helix-turn-helix transcriptional regulator [Streptosporangiaceae bacterium]|jgi:DNA-binding NarL/FixJ family response regulator
MTPQAQPVVILGTAHALAGALATGLATSEWLPVIAGYGDLAAVRGATPVVVTEDESGTLPRTAVSAAARAAAGGRRRVVVVAGPAALPGVLTIVAAGGFVVDANQPYQRLLLMLRRVLRAAPPAATQRERLLADLRRRADEAARFGALTARECAVLADIAAGHSAEAIAASRPVALATVRSQIAAVLRKLGVRSQSAAIALTYRSCADRRVTERLARFHQNYG